MLKPIPGFPDYFASEDGNIWSMKKVGKYGTAPESPRLLMKHLGGPRVGNDYFYSHLRVNGKFVKKKIAYLVLLAFVSERPPKMIICHGPLGRFDDSLGNLSWGSYSKNQKEDRQRDGTDGQGEANGRAILNKLQVRIIRHSYGKNGVGGLTQKQLGDVFNVSRNTICSIVEFRNWKSV